MTEGGAGAFLRSVQEFPKEPVLTFALLQAINVLRCEQVFHPLRSWSPLEWAGAMCGEAGEAANKAKKLRRHYPQTNLLHPYAFLPVPNSEFRGSAGQGCTLREAQELAREVAEEVADTVIYGALLCSALGLDLGKAVREKFNKVSRERQSTFLL